METESENENTNFFRNGSCQSVNEYLNKEYNDPTSKPAIRVITCIIYFCIFTVGVIGNALLINSLFLRKRFSVANLFLANLAISDLLLCITAVPATPMVVLLKEWHFGLSLCKIIPSCQVVSVFVSTYCLVFIAMDRYTSIVTPLGEPWTTRKSQVCICVTWIGAIVVSTPLYLTQDLMPLYINQTDGDSFWLCGEFCGEFNWPEGSMMLKLAYGSIVLVLQFLIPATTITFCYWHILQKVRTDWLVTEGSMLTATQQVQTSMRKRRVMYVLILMVVVFMTCWFPITVVNILRDLDFVIPSMYLTQTIIHGIAMSSVIWNPMLYFWLSKRHRRALKDDMYIFARRHPPGGLLSRFVPSPSVSFVYKRTLERHLANPHFRRGTLADPTNIMRENHPLSMQNNCFLLVPLMPLCQTVRDVPRRKSGRRLSNFGSERLTIPTQQTSTYLS